MRRCPARSLTIVGDVAQTGDLAGLPSWHEALDPYLEDRWRLAPLTVNYRTPAEVMAVAADVLAAIDPDARRCLARCGSPGTSRGSWRPPRTSWRRRWRRRLPGWPSRRATASSRSSCREALAAELGASVTAALPGTAIGADPDLTSPVVVLTVKQAKGLEFDCVLIADPARILAESPRGLNDLYVALTRATQQVGVVHAGALPARAQPAQRGRARQPRPS